MGRVSAPIRFIDMTGIEAFWEECDRNGIGDNPLVRELCDRLDAMQRCQRMIDDAEVAGNDEAIEILSAQYDRQRDIVRRIRQQLERATLHP